MRMLRHKKGYNLNEVVPVIVILLVIGIVIGLGQTILGEFEAQNCGDTPGAYWVEVNGTCLNDSTGADTSIVISNSTSYAYNATVSSMSGLDDFAGFQPTIAIVVVAGVILTIVAGVLMRKYL